MVIYIALGLILGVIAFSSAIVGIGGASLYTPVQMLFGIDIYEATATSLFLGSVLSVSAGGVYRKAGKIDWRLAMLLVLFSMSGAFTGAHLSKFIRHDVLTYILISIMAVSGLMMLRRERKGKKQRQGQESWYMWKRTGSGSAYTVNLLIALPMAVSVGVLAGLVGLGGGIFMVPAMTLIMQIPMDIAIASSTVMVGMTALAGLVGHTIIGHWDWKLSVALAPGVFLGAWLGAHTMLKIRQDTLKKTFGIFILAAAAALTIKMLT